MPTRKVVRLATPAAGLENSSLGDKIPYEYRTDPRQHQHRAFMDSRDRELVAIVADPGLGKSKITIDTVAYLYQSGRLTGALIVAPKAMYFQWLDEFNKHCPMAMLKRTLLYLWSPSGNQRNLFLQKRLLSVEPGLLKVAVMNTEAFSTKKGQQYAATFARKHSPFMVVDESSMMSNQRAKRTRAIISTGGVTSYRRILTGSPVRNSPLDVYAQYSFLNSKILGPSIVDFRARYCEMEDTYVAGGRVVKTIKGYRRLDELQRRLAPFTIRIRKEECPDLPLKTYLRRNYVMSQAQQEAYNQICRQALVELPDGRGRVTVKNVLHRLLRLHQVLSGFLVTDLGVALPYEDGDDQVCSSEVVVLSNSRVDDLVEQTREDDGKVVIWVCYRLDVVRIAEALEHEYGPRTTGKYMGGMHTEDRRAIIRRFLDPSDPMRFFVATQGCGKYGLNLVKPGTKIKTARYYQNGWSYETRIQSEDRIHRIGQEFPVTYSDMVAPGTLDERIMQALACKDELAAAVTGDNWRQWFQPVNSGESLIIKDEKED